MKKFVVLISLLLAPVLSLAEGPQTLAIQTEGRDQYYNYNFGTVYENTRTYADFTLTARGMEPVNIQRIIISGVMYDATSDCPEILPAGQTCRTRVTYWPFAQGPHFGELMFQLSEGNIYIRLIGNTFNRY